MKHIICKNICTIKALTTTETANKSSYHPYTLQLFFTSATIFSIVLYMDNDFPNNFFRKIFVEIFVVCV